VPDAVAVVSVGLAPAVVVLVSARRDVVGPESAGPVVVGSVALVASAAVVRPGRSVAAAQGSPKSSA
jgi:hypothetical protein